MMFYQSPGMGNEEYKRQFEAWWDTVGQFGGSVSNHPDLIAASAIEIAADNNRVTANGVGAPPKWLHSISQGFKLILILLIAHP